VSVFGLRRLDAAFLRTGLTGRNPSGGSRTASRASPDSKRRQAAAVQTVAIRINQEWPTLGTRAEIEMASERKDFASCGLPEKTVGFPPGFLRAQQPQTRYYFPCEKSAPDASK
jgi:hypothetical protein